jgi:antitoxin ParD1/3/4
LEKRTFSLPPAQERYIDNAVATGLYQSGDDVLLAGLDALQAHDELVEDWLRDSVVPVCDVMRSDPARGIPADQAFAIIRARHADRMKNTFALQD